MARHWRMRRQVIPRNWTLALPLLAAALSAAACNLYNSPATLPPPLAQTEFSAPSVASPATASPTTGPPSTASPSTVPPTTTPTAKPTATPTTKPTATHTAKPTPTPTPTPKAKAAGITIKTGHTALGSILVDSKGMTVYLFDKDTGPTSTCYGACATYWPPVVTKGAPVAGAGAKASLLGTSKRTNGTLQVTYAGHPLYYYLADSKPGQTNGQGIVEFGAKWHAVRPNGAPVG
jgi:predicted lipoprotein with Yx(FWY)xxD motif